MKHPAQRELDQLNALRAGAEKRAADAARYLAKLDAARVALSAAQSAFADSLDPKDAATLADAAAAVRYAASAASAVENAGGPDAFRAHALAAPQVLATFAAGFAARRDALEKLKPAARVMLAAATGQAVADGADPRALIGLGETPAMRTARELLEQIDRAADAALYAYNYASAPANHTPRGFAELFDLLAAPLPVLPGA